MPGARLRHHRCDCWQGGDAIAKCEAASGTRMSMAVASATLARHCGIIGSSHGGAIAVHRAVGWDVHGCAAIGHRNGDHRRPRAKHARSDRCARHRECDNDADNGSPTAHCSPFAVANGISQLLERSSSVPERTRPRDPAYAPFSAQADRQSRRQIGCSHQA